LRVSTLVNTLVDSVDSVDATPAPLEKLAFERGEETLTHGVVVGVSDRTRKGVRGSYAFVVSRRTMSRGGAPPSPAPESIDHREPWAHRGRRAPGRLP
jgi:hypothetical protein